MLSTAFVKLRSLDSDLDRDIIFSDKEHQLLSTYVGRASRNASRLMLPAKGNAWIESPVISRHHAKLSIQADEKRVSIDINFYVC